MKLEIKSWLSGSVLFEYESEGNTIKKTLENAVLRNAVLRNAVLRNAVLRNADLSGADLRNADLRNADLSGADLSGADLSGADLSGADLRNADLRNADLRNAVLSGADLSGADLRNADLRNAVLRNAVLSGAVLSGADLRNADLRNAVLSGADLSGADLRNAVLTPIKNDLFIVLLYAIPEIKFLKQNIVDGKIDGSTYDGKCACLSGTLKNGAIEHNGEKEKTVIKNILDCRDASRPIERFFLGIKIGDTPENNPISKLVIEWIEDFERLISML